MKPLEVWTCQRAENLKKKSSKIPKNNYAETMVSAARRQIICGGGAPINKSRRRRPQNCRRWRRGAPAHGSKTNLIIGESAGFSALALRKSRYCWKINVEKEISRLIQRFEKMCGDQQAHPSHK